MGIVLLWCPPDWPEATQKEGESVAGRFEQPFGVAVPASRHEAPG